MTPEHLFDLAIKLIELGIVPFAAYVIKAIAKINSKVDTISTVLIGADGKNGMRSRFRRIENKVETLNLAYASRFGIPTSINHTEVEEED